MDNEKPDYRNVRIRTFLLILIYVLVAGFCLYNLHETLETEQAATWGYSFIGATLGFTGIVYVLSNKEYPNLNAIASLVLGFELCALSLLGVLIPKMQPVTWVLFDLGFALTAISLFFQKRHP